MAPIFDSVGTLGAGNVKAGVDEITFNPPRAIPAGNLVVVWVGWDSIGDVYSEDPSGLHRDRMVISDTAGNFWAMHASATGGSCFFWCSSYISIYLCQLEAPLAVTDIISVELQASGILDAHVVSAWEFTIADGYGWASYDDDPARVEQVNTGASTISKGYADTRETLWLYGCAIEGPPTDSFTDDAQLTPIDSDGTTGGVDDDNITLHGGWLIDVSSSKSIDMFVSPSRDSMQVLGGIVGVLKTTRFPTTPLLDDFNRADEEPLDNAGLWGLHTSGPSSPGIRYLAVEGNEAVAGVTNAGGQTIEEIIECDDVEVWATYSHVDTGSHAMVVVAHQLGETENATASGYQARFAGPGWTHSPDYSWWAIQMGAQGNQGIISQVELWFWVPPDFSPDDGWKIGIQRRSDVNHLWVDRGGVGWKWMGAIVTRRGDRNHSGRIGLALWDPISRADDFGGGGTCFDYMVGMNWREANRAKSATRALVNPSDV